ncbi:hypothetical protein [Streptomyces zaomyceticus]|uniref:hypothetical protein n=1 Tax=Streptomyces zaomyceticus TaxID=68286 RepID=UPI002E2214DE
MIERDSESDAVQELEVPEDDQLSRGARAGAAAVGTLLLGAGGTAVFVTENQAGCVALILAGAIFLLMVFGGTPMHSLGFGEANLRFARRRRDEVVREALQSPPERAPEALSALEAVASPSRPDPTVQVVSERVYEEAIRHQISEFLPPGRVLRDGASVGPRGWRADFVVESDGRLDVVVETRYSRYGNPLPVDVVRQMLAIHEVSGAPVLIVCSSRPSTAARYYLESIGDSAPVRVVRWANEADDDELRSALLGLLS